MITVQLLGGASLRSDGVALVGPPAQRHRLALLALVVDAWPQPLARDRALALLWPERDAPAGRRLLNLAVHVLRNALGDTTITSLGDGLLFEPGHMRCDLHDLRRAVAADDHDGVDRRIRRSAARRVSPARRRRVRALAEPASWRHDARLSPTPSSRSLIGIPVMATSTP